jgi:hypothetical protein
MARSKFNFDVIAGAIKKSRPELMLIMANAAKNEFLNNFRQQGFGANKWQEVKRRIPGTPEYKYPKDKDPGRHTRDILIGKGSGRLRKDVANSVTTGHPVPDGYVMVVNNDYGIYHNEGDANLPKRQFVGTTPELTAVLKNKIVALTNEAFKK